MGQDFEVGRELLSIVEGLGLLEGDNKTYQPLLTLFDEMIDFQIANMGQATYKRNYQNK